MKKTLCLALALLLAVIPPLTALAAGAFSLSGRVSFTVSDALEGDGLKALADVLRMLEADVLYASEDGSFDLQTVLRLDGEKRTDTPVHFFGLPGHIAVQSRLLGEETLMFNMEALMEFALKIHFHMGIPLHRLAFLVPYVTEDAFRLAREETIRVFGPSDIDRCISHERFRAWSERMLTLTEEDRSLNCYMQALACDCSLGERLSELIAALPDWLEAHDESGNGLLIYHQGSHEYWSTWGGLAADRNLEDGSLSVSLEDVGGMDVAFTLTSGEDTSAFALRWTAGEEILLEAEGSLGAGGYSVRFGGETAVGMSLPVFTDGAWRIKTVADAEERVSLALRTDGDSLSFGDGEETLLTLHLARDSRTAGPCGTYTDNSVPGRVFFSLDDVSLKELVGHIALPFAKGAIPLIAKLPAAAVTLLVDTLEDGGIFSPETYASSGDNGYEWEGEWEEEGWEDWGDESGWEEEDPEDWEE